MLNGLILALGMKPLEGLELLDVLELVGETEMSVGMRLLEEQELLNGHTDATTWTLAAVWTEATGRMEVVG